MLLYFMLCLALSQVCTCKDDDILVETSNGKIRGIKLIDRIGNGFYSFTSVPFAKPPLGELRFKAPKPAEPWDGILDATKAAPMCVQYEFERIVGKEDCLYLNIYTPTVENDEKLPVMIYIHGGAYFEGSGSSVIYGPQFLLAEKVVLVTINYRLGRFGSLSFEDQTLGVPGNAHLKDQVMALKWVQDNIHNFSGDKNCVTLFGESVGGASVHMHMLSPMSKGLFHRIISQSGTALNPWNYGILGTGKLVAEKLGIQSEDVTEIIKQLQAMPVEKIMETQSKDGLGVPVHTKFEYSPVVEKQTNEPHFLSDLPIHIIESGNYSKVPFMLGYNSNDTLIFQVIERLYNGATFFIEDFESYIPHDLHVPQDKRKEVAAEIKEHFYGNETDFSNVEKFSKTALGAWITCSYKRALKRHLKTTDAPIYFYVFSGDTKLNFFKRLHPVTAAYKGASHMDELGHLFKTKFTPCVDVGSPEEKALNNMVKLWTNFAKYGNPTPSNSNLGKVWLPVTKDAFYYCDIGVELKPGVNPNNDIFTFWDSLYNIYK